MLAVFKFELEISLSWELTMAKPESTTSYGDWERVLAEPEIKHETFKKKMIFKQFFEKKSLELWLFPDSLIYGGIDSELSSQSNYNICNSILVWLVLFR